MKDNGKDGDKIRSYLKKNKINQTELANKMGLTRQGLIFHLGKQRVDYEFKEKLRDAGADVFGMGDKDSQTGESKPQNSIPQTHAEMFQLMREALDSVKGENEILKKYVRLLEDRQANK